MAVATLAAVTAAVAMTLWQGGSAQQGSDQARDAQVEQAMKDAQMDSKDRAAIEAVVRDYILSHPEIIPEAVRKLQNKQLASNLDSMRKQIETPFYSAWAGKENASVTLVKYSDYACGYCRKSVEDVTRLLAEDKDLKVVFQELPILSDQSAVAANWAMAAAQQGKYLPFYKALFAAGKPSQDNIEKAARQAGLDMESARAFVSKGGGEGQIDTNVNVARQLEFTGTPSWVVGDQVLNGAVGYDELKQAIENARKG